MGVVGEARLAQGRERQERAKLKDAEVAAAGCVVEVVVERLERVRAQPERGAECLLDSAAERTET